MIANSEKMKVKKSYPILVSTPIQFFRNFILPWGVGGGGGGTNVCSSKSLRNII